MGRELILGGPQGESLAKYLKSHSQWQKCEELKDNFTTIPGAGTEPVV